MSDGYDERDPRPTADTHSDTATNGTTPDAPATRTPVPDTAAEVSPAAGPPTQTGGAGQAPPPPPATAGPYHGGPAYPVQQPPGGPARKPELVNAIAIFNIVDGILNVLYAAGVFFGLTMFGLSTLGCGCLLLPLGLYPLVLGVLELIYGARLLPADPRDVTPARWLAVLQIVNLLLGQVVSVVGGILTLIFLDNPEVRRWFAERAPRGYAGR